MGAAYTILMFSFADQQTAGEVVKEIKAGNALDGYTIAAEAVAERDPDGKLEVHEPGRGGVGATVGAVAGGLLGLFGGPFAVLALAVAGGVTGGIAGHFAGRALPMDDLKKAADALPPNSSAFLLLLEDTETEKAMNALSGYNANVVTIAVGSELSGEIGAAVIADVEATGDQQAASGATSAAPPASAPPAPSTDDKPAGQA
jgi:uncharacterized membrane protein